MHRMWGTPPTGYSMSFLKMNTKYLGYDDIKESCFGLKDIANEKRERKKHARHTLVFFLNARENIAKALKKKEKNPTEINKKLLKGVIRDNYTNFQKHGIDFRVLTRATTEVNSYMSGEKLLTKKQLESLLSAAVALTLEDMVLLGNNNAHSH